MLSLQHPYISVEVHGRASFGGWQQYSPDPMVRRCGCGVIAAADLLLYLALRHGPGVSSFDGLPEDGPIPLSDYNDLILRLHRRYFPVIPFAGINGPMLMAGVLRFFHDHQMPFSARWCFSQQRLWERMESRLGQDIPVILSVGPNFPAIWGKKVVRFYKKTAAGTYIPTAGTKAHFITVTGMDEDWLRISSWGRLYYLSRTEFIGYARGESLPPASNILLVERRA